MPTQLQGSLTIAGSGIASIGQLTLQTIAAIENADIVCYVLNDPAAEAYIRKKNPNVYDMYQLYDDGKNRAETYFQMVEVMLNKVRSGQNVVGLFYGHPGVFVSPSHRAIKVAREEGYQARMLPGISAEDCLYADLGVDPGIRGLVTYEATDLLQSNRPLNPGSDLILWQVGVIGNSGFDFVQMENPQFDKLVARLEEAYGADGELTHYIAPVLPIDEPVIEKLKISDLKKEEIKKKVNPGSTFYIPSNDPTRRGALDFEGAEKLRKVAISALANHQPGKNYNPLKENTALAEALEQLALDPGSLQEFKADRQSWVDKSGLGLNDAEKNALVTGQGVKDMLLLKGPGAGPVPQALLVLIVISLA